MIRIKEFDYKPGEHEAERASNSYLMSLVAIIVGFPLPVINFLATLFFYFGNRKSSYFVRWHCSQALLTQFSVLIMNSVGFWWTLSIIFTDTTLNNNYIAYMITIFIFNLIEFIGTVIAAIYTRKGKHVQWWFYNDITDSFVKKND